MTLPCSIEEKTELCVREGPAEGRKKGVDSFLPAFPADRVLNHLEGQVGGRNRGFATRDALTSFDHHPEKDNE